MTPTAGRARKRWTAAYKFRDGFRKHPSNARPGEGAGPGATARRWRRLAVVGVAAALLVTGGAVWWAGPRPLHATGPVTVAGSTADANFSVGGLAIRQVRYLDRHELRYGFTLANRGAVPVTVTGLSGEDPRLTLMRLRGLAPEGFTLGPYGTRRVELRILMTDCEKLSARAGSLLRTVRIDVRVLGLAPRSAEVTLPEALRLGSAREAACPRATSRSRSPG
ncbi:MAG: hypothetical protein ACRDT6_07660 [Micromonosporaceae bacterium]